MCVCDVDEDVLDTWFSSGLFPFSIFGWPDTVSLSLIASVGGWRGRAVWQGQVLTVSRVCGLV